MTYTAWVESRNARDDGGGGGSHTDPVKNISLYHSMTFPLLDILLDVSLITSLKPNLCTTVTKQNTVENKFIVSHAQNATALRTNVFLTGIRRLLVTNTGRSAFHRANHCQGQLQTPQSVTAVTLPTKP